MGVTGIRRALALGALAASALAAPAAAQSVPALPVPALPVPVLGGKTGAPVQPYGTNDARGFRNILPAGQTGTDNLAQFTQFQTTGTRPAHWDDQIEQYSKLIFASPTLTHAQVNDFFKDATFGVPDGGTESTIVPRDGVTIVRDTHGVPHIYGTTRGNVEFGAGYAGAQDRLFLMDVLRHTARAQLSSFVGGSPGNREMDRAQWAAAPYTEADLQRQIDQAPVLYGDEGRRLIDDASAYVAGINAYIDEARTDPSKMPSEYALFGKTGPDPWQLTDVIAEASLIGGIFGKGGGNELRSALFEQTLEAKFGASAGKRAWADFRSKNDPEAPTTVKGTSFPYETASAFSPSGLAIPDPCSVTFAPVAPPVSGAVEQAPCARASTAANRASRARRARRAAARTRAARPRKHAAARKRSPRRSRAAAAGASIGAEMMRALRSHHDMSNWELVSGAYSSNGHPIGVLGPQVGYYDPQILLEEDLHGPGFDARGASFPGVSLMVQLGHGRDYAWSATTATSDNVDTFAEVTCGGDDHHYLYKGQCLAMDRLDRTNTWTPNASDHTPPGSETLTAWRTVHGIVYAYGTVGGRRVAFALSRTTYMHEADSALGFFRLNNPDYVHDVQSFRHAVDGINFGFNWAYIDSQHIAYQQSGWYPQRADGTSPDFPVLGTGEFDWKGFDPAAHTSAIMSLDQRPHAVDPPFLVSWNNKQAPGWAAADDKYTYGPVFRSQMIESRIRAAEAKGPVALQQVVTAMDEPATQDLSAWALMPILKTALGTPADKPSRDALALLSDWAARGAHRRDLNQDGRDEDATAIAIMDAWYPRLTQAEFGGALGDQALAELTKIVRPESVMPATGDQPAAPDYDDGWFSFVSKDLRDVFTPSAVTGKWSRGYCGGGSAAQCRADLQASLRDALAHADPAALYGRGDCASDATARCFDQNRDVAASGISMPPFPFQNRPTFQQTVELTLGPRAKPAARSTAKKKAKAKAKKRRARRRVRPKFTG